MATIFRTAFVDDKKVNRNTFQQKVASLPAIEVIFMAADGHQCLEELKGLPQNRMPQVLFMDLEMPGMDGIETIRLAKAMYPAIHFIVLTVFDDDEKIFEAIRAGASGYLLKHEPAAVLEDAVINVMDTGGAPMSPAVARKALQLLSRSPETSSSPAAGRMPVNITTREQEILQHMVNGWESKRIAAELGLSVLTVRKHIANIYEKLHVSSKAQVISLAHKNKWV